MNDDSASSPNSQAADSPEATSSEAISSEAVGGGEPTPGAIRFSWPPPGLESIQGDLWPTTGTLATGGLILVLPLLWSVGREVPFHSLGPFGDTWWVMVLTSLVGLLLVLSGLGSLFRLFRTGRKASRLGITPRTVLLVAADREGDTGFLLQGARAYQTLDEGSRERLAGARIWGSVLYLLAALWASLGFFLSVMLAARGVLGTQGVWILTLGPVGAFLVVGLVARAYQGTVRRKARRGLPRDPWKSEELRASVKAWQARRGEGSPDDAPARGVLWAGSWGLALVAILIALPAFTLTLTNSVGPILASIAVPNFSRTQERAAKAEVYRRYRLNSDPSITPLEAGESLANLGSVEGYEDISYVKTPPRAYDDAFSWDTETTPVGIPPREWGEKLFPRVAAGLTAEERAFLEAVAAHPALDEFGVLARAPAADFLGARYTTPFPDGTTVWELPLPKFSRARMVAHGMVARAAVRYLDGDPGGAEETLREIISAGFLLADDSPTLIGNLIGYVIVETGGTALGSFYRIRGREAEAETLTWGQTVTEKAVAITRANAGAWSVEGYLRQVPQQVTGSEETIRGLRWEHFMMTMALAPCLNAHKVVFGPGEDMAAFVQEARQVLVRYPSEGALFDLARNGWFGNPEEAARSHWLGRIVELTLGGSGTPGSCAAMMSQIDW